MKRVVLLAVLVLSIAVAPAAHACRVLKMKNDTGQGVNDLHFETNKGKVDFSFANLPDGNTIEVTITASPDCQNIKITKWWWTNNNAVIGGKKNGEPKCLAVFGGGNANGNGLIKIRIEGVDHLFSPTPGDSPTQSALKLTQFLQGITSGGRSLIYVQGDAVPGTVIFYGNDVGDAPNELVGTLLNPDSGQNISLQMGIAIPGITPVGLGLLALALLALSCVFIVRRRAASSP